MVGIDECDVLLNTAGPYPTFVPLLDTAVPMPTAPSNGSDVWAAVLALAACAVGLTKPTPSPAPPTNLKIGYGDTLGIFYMSPGQTLLVELDYPFSRDKAVLGAAGRYSNGTVFKAAAVGRTNVTAYPHIDCPIECNPPAPLQITVVVIEDTELQNGLVISEQDQVIAGLGYPSVIHLRSGQRFVLTLRNLPQEPAWARLTSSNPAVIEPEQPATMGPDGIQRAFRAANPGRTGVWATGTDCPSGNPCPTSPYSAFTFQVFS